MADDEFRIIPNPQQVEAIRRVVLYRHDGMPLTRQIGFRAMQTSGTFPELASTKRKPKKGKKG